MSNEHVLLEANLIGQVRPKWYNAVKSQFRSEVAAIPSVLSWSST